MTAHSVLYKALGAFEDAPAMLCRLRDTVLGSTCRPETVTDKPFLRSRFRLAAPRARSERCPKRAPRSSKRSGACSAYLSRSYGSTTSVSAVASPRYGRSIPDRENRN
jgi:hypothetical protein